MKKVFLLILGIVGYTVSLNAQSTSQIKPLSIGDTVPDIVLNNIINYKTSSAKLSDFRGKLVILDFWATWCSSCIEGFPKLASLQDSFKQRLQVMLINAKSTNDSKAKISSFFKKYQRPDGTQYRLPVIAQDTLLCRLFPHQLIPHYVWIGPSGIVRGITASSEVNQQHIQELLTEKNANMRRKQDIINFERNRPLFLNSQMQIPRNDLKFYQVICGYIPGIPSGVFGSQDSAGFVTRLCFTNLPLKQLYRIAYYIQWPDNRILLEVKDPADLSCTGDSCDEWSYSHSYCYELYTPPIHRDKAYRRMQQDLVDYFGYHASIADRRIKCLIVKKDLHRKKLEPYAKKPANNLGVAGVPNHYIHHQPISILVDYLNRNLPWPVLDETGYTQPVNLQLPRDLSDLGLLKKALGKDGFDLNESIRTIKVFVLSGS